MLPAGKGDHRLFGRASHLNACDPLLTGCTHEFSCLVKGPTEIVPNRARFYELHDFLFGQKTVAMHRTTDTHISYSYEGHIGLVRKFFHNFIQTVVAPLSSLLRRVREQWSRY